MAEILYGKIKHSYSYHRYIDAVYMSYEEYFSKYEITFTNKIIRVATRFILTLIVAIIGTSILIFTLKDILT